MTLRREVRGALAGPIVLLGAVVANAAQEKSQDHITYNARINVMPWTGGKMFLNFEFTTNDTAGYNFVEIYDLEDDASGVRQKRMGIKYGATSSRNTIPRLLRPCSR